MTTLFVFLILPLLAQECLAQINRPPEFLPGGDMEKFSIREDTPVGSLVYRLRGHDPENTRVYYYISGDTFTVEKDTGAVKLIRPLDRETESIIDVIISITDEKVQGQDPNTISIKREINVLDYNDNKPTFQNVPYAFFVDETAPIRTAVYKGVLVTDADIGSNAEIKLSCIESLTRQACEKFSIEAVPLGVGKYRGEIMLKNSIDYEKQSMYTMAIMAEDLSLTDKLNSTVNVIIDVRDIQDQLPVFQNAPYSATVLENSPPGTSVLTITARDGDAGDPSPLHISVANDEKGYFMLSPKEARDKGSYSAVLQTSAVPIDREDTAILNNGGLYTFLIQATELVNGKPVGDSVVTNVTIVVSDMNDQIPMFNDNHFNITIPEDIGNNTPLPGLNIVASDTDVGDNAKFSLRLENVLNSEGVFMVFPTMAVGRTPVIIKVADSSKLDYEQEDKRKFVFNVVAYQEDTAMSTATITISLLDANDNPPVFENDEYSLRVLENTPPRTIVFTLQAHDADSGNFGQLTYSLKGYGSDRFQVQPNTGKITVAPCENVTVCLDYETIRGYSLTYEARDGGGRVASVNVFVEIVDKNDNAPVFTQEEYSQELMENTRRFTPPLILKAFDMDGPTQGGGKVTYSIRDSNLHIKDAVVIDARTGELSLQTPIKYTDTPDNSGQFILTVVATDAGSPPLSSEVKLIIKVKKENDGAPEFVNTPYHAMVKENAREGSSVLKLVATDPDGPDSEITYYIESGTKDNFIIAKHTGLVTVAPGANLDRDLQGFEYHIVVHAVDAGTPIQQTATATLVVTIEDVNNKPPVFLQESYVQHISESLPIGEEVLNVTASDPDADSKIRYSITEPISARDKTGSVVTSTSAYNYKAAFRIDGTTGQVTVNQPLDYNAASVIILTVQAVDLNAVDAVAGGQQRSSVEVTIYIQAHSNSSPVFSPPWTPANPQIDITVPEETTIGSTLLTLTAYDPLTNQPVTQFEKVLGSDTNNFVSVTPVSGVVTLNRRLDFEDLPLKYITFQVRATIESNLKRTSVATVVVHVQDTNDNSPVFSQDSYMTRVSESAQYPQTLLTVLAFDKDSHAGYGTIRYSVSGDGSDVFSIDENSGTIQVKEGAVLDREKQPTYNLQVTATDNPSEGSNQRRTSVLVLIQLLDENDNAPVFEQPVYTAVVPENVPTNFTLITVKATDSDQGSNGEVQYSIIESSDGEPLNFFAVHPQTGVVSVMRPLAGKGRSEPYTVTLEATDKGVPPQSGQVPLLVIIGDVMTNDGVPQFIKPVAGEVAYIPENATIGTSVFQVVAYDPDSPSSANGKVAYKFLEKKGSEEDFEFAIDAATGVITTQAHLDREKTENYTLIVVSHDFGFPPQEAHRVLQVVVLDMDDNEPYFDRPVNSEPVDMVIMEEVPVGTVLGQVHAVDKDTGRNALMDYYIIYGNEDEIFGIRRTSNNTGEVYTKQRVDHEARANYLLTIKVGKAMKFQEGLVKPYNPSDLTEMQVSVVVRDVDDNAPVFENDNYILGVRLDTEVDTQLVTLKATDADSISGPIMYNVKNVTFFRPATRELKEVVGAFEVNHQTGALSTTKAFHRYVNGFFNIRVEARSSPGIQNSGITHVKVYVLHDRELLKFIFYKQPSEVREILPQFQKDLRRALAMPVTVNIYDTQFYSRGDGGLDFESTSSCFQMLENEAILDPEKVFKLMDPKKSGTVQQLYNNYSIIGIERCGPGKDPYCMSWSEIAVLVVAALIAIIAFVVTVILCFMYSRYKQRIKKTAYFNNLMIGNHGASASILTPTEHQRIYEWQEMNTPMADAVSFHSFPTLR